MTREDTEVVVDLCAVLASQSMLIRKLGRDGLDGLDLALLRAGEATITNVKNRALKRKAKALTAGEKP